MVCVKMPVGMVMSVVVPVVVRVILPVPVLVRVIVIVMCVVLGFSHWKASLRISKRQPAAYGH